MAAAFWATATIVTADQHAHAPVPHPTQTHGRPATITPSTQTGGTHHDGDHHSGAHHEVDHHSGAHHEVDHHSGPHTPPPSTVATKIQSHPKLAAKVTAMLPPGMTMTQAALGFRNQGQFIAALHASQRTGIPFADLKRAMVVQHESLGQAIHSLRPATSGSREAEHAEHEADHDLGGSHSGTGGTTSGSTTTGRTTAGTTTGTTTSTTTTSTTARKHDE